MVDTKIHLASPVEAALLLMRPTRLKSLSLWTQLVHAETRWKKIACAFGNVRANLNSMAREQCQTFLQGKRLGKVSWHDVYRLKGTFTYQDDTEILMKKEPD